MFRSLYDHHQAFLRIKLIDAGNVHKILVFKILLMDAWRNAEGRSGNHYCNGKEIMPSPIIVGLIVTLAINKILRIASKRLMANSCRRQFDLHIKFPPYLSDFN